MPRLRGCSDHELISGLHPPGFAHPHSAGLFGGLIKDSEGAGMEEMITSFSQIKSGFHLTPLISFFWGVFDSWLIFVGVVGPLPWRINLFLSNIWRIIPVSKPFISLLYIPYRSWDWYIYLHENHKNQPFMDR